MESKKIKKIIKKRSMGGLECKLWKLYFLVNIIMFEINVWYELFMIFEFDFSRDVKGKNGCIATFIDSDQAAHADLGIYCFC